MTFIIVSAKACESPLLNKKPVLSLTTVSLDPPMSLAITGFYIDWASTETLPKASGSIEQEQTKLATP